MNRNIDNRTFLTYLLPTLNVNDLKQICRDHNISGYSKLNKGELIEFILDSLAEEEMERYIKENELDSISDQIEIAFQIINGKYRETIEYINVVNPERHDIELKFKGFNWEVGSFLSINKNNIENPERDCDCRIGANMGFCSHFWVGFIYSLKKDFFNLEDWTLTELPEDFEEKIESIDIIEPSKGEQEEQTILIDKDSDSSLFMELMGASITVHEGEIQKIEERTSEFQGNVTKFYIISLAEVKIGPRNKKSTEIDEDTIKEADKLKIRLSERLQEENDLKVGDKIQFNGKLDKDNFWGFIVKNIRKVEKL